MKDTTMKTILAIILFIVSITMVQAQKVHPYPINGDHKFYIKDLATFENKVAVLGYMNENSRFGVFVYEDNGWKELPQKAMINGNEEYIVATKPRINSGPRLNSRGSIQYDNNGTIWLSAVDGIFNFVDGAWNHYAIQGLGPNVTSYQKIIFDKAGNLWMYAEVYRGDGQSGYSNVEIYRFSEGKFYRYFDNVENFSLIHTGNGSSQQQWNTDINSNPLKDGIMLRYKQTNIDVNLVHLKTDGSFTNYIIPTTDLPIFNPTNKVTNQIYTDSKDRTWFLMPGVHAAKGTQNVNPICCGGLARLDNGTEWYKYTSEKNDMPYAYTVIDSAVKYLSVLYMSELPNDEYLFMMRSNAWKSKHSMGIQPLIFKLDAEDKFHQLNWNTYFENAVAFRADYHSFTEDSLLSSLDDVKNNIPLLVDRIMFQGMKQDGLGNLWIYGENFVLKATDDPTTSVAETTIKKPTVIYPNPGNQTIRIANARGDIDMVEIQNLTGTTMKTVEGSFREIPVYELPVGVYFVKISRNDGSIEVVKFIKE